MAPRGLQYPYLKNERYWACSWAEPCLARFLVVIWLDRPVPLWSISTTLKLLTATFSQELASVGRGDSKPGPPGSAHTCVDHPRPPGTPDDNIH